jgi:high-affinity Fe2+/Pb2+ permease
MMIATIMLAVCVGFFTGAWWRMRSDADNDKRMSAEITRLGEAIGEALKPEID